MQLLEGVITLILDGCSSVFEMMDAPNFAIIREAFFISLIFLVASVVFWFFDLLPAIDIGEALTATIILAIMSLIDANTRAQLKAVAKKVRSRRNGK